MSHDIDRQGVAYPQSMARVASSPISVGLDIYEDDDDSILVSPCRCISPEFSLILHNHQYTDGRVGGH